MEITAYNWPYFLSTEGAQFFSLVKSLARRYGDNEKLYFLWVDPDPFPTVSCARAADDSDTSCNVDKIGKKLTTILDWDT